MISREIKNQVFERDNHKCKFCGFSNDLTIDHITPKSKDYDERSRETYINIKKDS